MSETVRVCVLKAGDGRVFTGDYDETSRSFTKYASGDEFNVASDIAGELADRGFVTIVGTETADAPRPALLPTPTIEASWQPAAHMPADEESRKKWSALAIA